MSAAPAKDNKAVLVTSIFGVLLVVFAVYAYNAFSGGSAPAPTPAATTTTAAPVVAPVKSSSASSAQSSGPNTGLGVAPGVAAKKMASTSSSLDPTLDESAMLRTEGLVYTGSGRNIFSLVYEPPPPPVSHVPPPRPTAPVAVVPTGPPPVPPPPPINLKFFGVATRANGARQAFLLSGEDVYMASQNDIVARKYKIVSIGTNSIQVEDLSNQNTQTLPLQQN